MSRNSNSPIGVGVIGLGLIGGSILRRLSERSSEYSLVGFDTDQGTRAAVESTGVDVASSPTQVAEAADLVVVAVPPDQAADAVIGALNADPRVLVTDVASVKASVLDRVRSYLPGALDRFLPSHPLAGAETTGWHSTRPDLLDGTIWAVCPPSPGAPAELLSRWSRVFDAFDARLVVCDPVEHDAAVARTSHVPHLTAQVIARSLAGCPTKLAAVLSGGGFRDMTRIARSNPTLWKQILDLNREAVVAVIDEWLADLGELRAAVADTDEGPIIEAWKNGEAMIDLVEELRWTSCTWETRTFEWPAWDELLTLGRGGRSVRRVVPLDGGISADVSTLSEGDRVAVSRGGTVGHAGS